MAQWNSGLLKHRADPDGELAVAVVAAPQKPLVALAVFILHLVHVGGLALRAVRFTFPKPLFKEFNRRSFVAAGHRNLSNRFRVFQVRVVFVNLHAFTLYYTQHIFNNYFTSLFR